MKKIAVVDLGGTEIKAGTIDCHGAIADITQVPTRAQEGFDAIVEALLGILAPRAANASGVAIASAGTIDPYRGVCVRATSNLPNFGGFAIKAFVQDKFGLPCAILNDGHAALMGEISYGKHDLHGDVIMLTLGTGVGGALYDAAKGCVKFGEDFEFGRFGHEVLYEHGVACNCGKRGCIEQYVSATSLVKRAQERGLGVQNAKQVFDGARAGDTVAKLCIQDFTHSLTDTLLLLNGKYGVRNFILGGGILGAQELFLPAVRGACAGLNIEAATLQNRAGMFGAYRWFTMNGE